MLKLSSDPFGSSLLNKQKKTPKQKRNDHAFTNPNANPNLPIQKKKHQIVDTNLFVCLALLAILVSIVCFILYFKSIGRGTYVHRDARQYLEHLTTLKIHPRYNFYFYFFFFSWAYLIVEYSS